MVTGTVNSTTTRCMHKEASCITSLKNKSDLCLLRHNLSFDQIVTLESVIIGYDCTAESSVFGYFVLTFSLPDTAEL